MREYIKNNCEQPGTVTAVHAVQGAYEEVSRRWHDCGVDLPLNSAAAFTLLSRRST